MTSNLKLFIVIGGLFLSLNSFAALTTPSMTQPASSATNIPVSLLFKWTTNYNAQFELDTSINFNSPVLFKALVYRQIQLRKLKFNTKYYWRVRAYTGTDSSAWTTKRSFTTLVTPVISAPKDKDTSSYMVASLGCQGTGSFIRVQMDTSGKFNSKLLVSFAYNDTTPLTTYPIGMTIGANNRLLFNTKYYVRMKAYHATDSSAYNTISFKTMRGPIIQYPKGGPSTITDAYVYCNPVQNMAFSPAVSDSLIYEYQLDTSKKFNSPAAHFIYPQGLNAYASNIEKFGQTFYVRVRGKNPINTSPWSPYESFSTYAAPLITTPAANDSIIRPDSQVFATNYFYYAGNNYELQLDTSKTFNSPSLVKKTYPYYTTAFDMYGMLFNRKYYSRFRAIGFYGDTSKWSYRTFYTNYTQKLTSPSNGSTFNITGPKLVWEKLKNATSYEYLLDTVPTFNSSIRRHILVRGNVNGDTAKYLYFDKKYYWCVRAAFANDTAGWSATSIFSTSPMAVYINSPYQNETNVAINPTSLDWNTIDYNFIKGYHYQLSKDTFFANPINGYTNGNNSYADVNGLSNSTKYFLRVRCFHNNDTNDWYYERRFFTKDPDPVPAAPVKIAPANGSIKQLYTTLTLSWQATTYATSYDIESDVSNSFSNPTKGNFTATLINITNLTPNTTYYWRVRALNGKIAGPWSTVWNFTTLPPVVYPLNLSPDNFEEKPRSFYLKWDAVFMADYYEYQISNSLTYGSQVIRADGNSAPLTNLTDGKTYYWRVRTIILPYNSAWSNDAIFRVNGTISGLENISAEAPLSAYPNPGTGLFYLKGSASANIHSIDIFDLMGKKIKAIPINNMDDVPSVDLSDLPDGIYFLRTISDDQPLVIKVCKF